MVLTDIDVCTHHRANFAGATQTELYWGIRTDV